MGTPSPTPSNFRPALASHLRQRLRACADGFRHNLALIGPPGSGKTFQLHQLLADHPAPLLFIYCPVYRESCRMFLNRLLGAILRAGISHLPSDLPSGEPLEPLLNRAEGVVPKTVTAARQIEELIARRLYGEAFNRTLDTIPQLIEERRQPTVLILDEFLALEELGLGHAFHELGKRVMTWPSTLFVLASSSPHRAKAILRERLQLLFGQFELLTLGGLEISHAAAWIRQELRGLRGTASLSPFLLTWVGASPWYVTVMVRRLKELAVLQQARELTESLFLQTAWDVLGAPEGTLHQWCASQIHALTRQRFGARALEALLEVAGGVRTTTEIGRRIGRAGLPSALQLLLEQDLAQRSGTCWMVSDPLLRCWLSTILSAQRSAAPAGHAESRDRFERFLTGLWTRWVDTNRLSFPEQVVSLLSRFSDETVVLDSKTGRLPRFRTVSPQPGSDAAQTYVVADDGHSRRWCVTVHGETVQEQAITRFETFCRSQPLKPSRKVVVAQHGLDDNAKLLAKTCNMWVWEPDALQVLTGLYGQVGG